MTAYANLLKHVNDLACMEKVDLTEIAISGRIAADLSGGEYSPNKLCISFKLSCLSY